MHASTDVVDAGGQREHLLPCWTNAGGVYGCAPAERHRAVRPAMHGRNKVCSGRTVKSRLYQPPVGSDSGLRTRLTTSE
eukprot:364233-Chlamydomonas_euryale.AAC.12